MKTMNTSTCCPIFDANRDFFAQGHAGADHIFSFFRKFRLDWLLLHFPPRLVRSVYVFVNGFITIGVLALLALVSRNPFVFPSLGPTAYLLFFTPLGRTSSPRKYCFGSCYWSHMLLCGIRCHGCRRTAIRSPSGNFLAKNPGSGSFPLGYRRIHGFF